MNTSYALTEFARDSRRGSSLLWWSGIAMLLGMIMSFAMLNVDGTMVNGVSAWEKPAKFFFSLVVTGGTLAWAISLLERPARGVSTAVVIFFAAGWLELAYITIRAARGEMSHFNTGTPTAAILYSIMGVGALSLTAMSGFIGWRVWQQRNGSLMREAAGLGLMLGALLGTMTAGYLSSMPSHWVGGDQTDATGLGFFHWSTTGGDLRVAHFIGLHAMQFLPLAALSKDRRVVYAAALATVIATAGTFFMAISGMPLLRA
jgi:hypothetical protein